MPQPSKAFGISQLVRQAGSRQRWLYPVPFGRGGPWECRSSGTGPGIPGSPSRQSQRSCIPPGTGASGEEGTGKQEFSCHWAPRKLCRSVYLCLPPGASKQVRTGRLWFVTHGELNSRAGNLAAAIVVLPPFTLCLGEAWPLGTNASQDKQLILSPAPGKGRDISAQAQTPENQDNRPLPQKNCWKN